MARASCGGLAGHPRHLALVAADHRQSPHGQHTADQPLVERPALCQCSRAYHFIEVACQRGAFVLGWARSGYDTVLRPASATTSRWRSELRAARHARGILTRGEQLWLLAGRRSRRAVLQLRLSDTARLRRPTCPTVGGI